MTSKMNRRQALALIGRAVPIDRMKSKLELAAEYCEDIGTWGYREICRPANGPKGETWYAQYRDYYESSR